MTTQYHLVSSKGSYWRHEGKGYTTDIHEAGVFDEGLARGVVADTHGEVRMVEVAKPEEGSTILASNLEAALRQAIQTREMDEREMGFTRDSCGLAAWRENLSYLRVHGTLRIKP